MDMQDLVSLCRKRGFIFGSSEIYGGINGFWDYGPLGVELKKNLEDVLQETADPILSATARSTTVALQIDFGGPEHQARIAIRQFAQKNNVAALKKFMEGPTKRKGQVPIIFLGGKDDGGLDPIE